MSPFDAIRGKVTARQVAESCGLKIGRNGMACCPFHNDRHPSMKIDTRFHCFGCGADGDAIDFISKYAAFPLRMQLSGSAMISGLLTIPGIMPRQQEQSLQKQTHRSLRNSKITATVC